MKKHAFNVMSDERCECGKRIKLNVAERIQRRPLDCYGCWTGKLDVLRANQRPHGH